MLIRPKRLEKNDVVGIIAPSSPAASMFRHRFDRGIKTLQNLGVKVKFGKCTIQKFGYMSGIPKDRSDDINSMFADREVSAIFTNLGGYNSNQLLDLIDYETIKRNPKIFMGYSDTTVLLLAIHAKTGLVTFHGPAILPQFSEFPKILDYTVENMEKVLCSSSSEILLKPSKMWTNEHLDWTKYDMVPRKLVKNEGWKFLRSGEAEGHLIGGNLQTIQTLIGTDYLPSFKNSIFFWEETETSTAEIDRTLNHFKHAGILDEINGMMVGRLDSDVKISNSKYDLNKIILETTKDFDFPIIVNMDFGHTDPMLTIPIGTRCKINANKTISLESSVV